MTNLNSEFQEFLEESKKSVRPLRALIKLDAFEQNIKKIDDLVGSAQLILVIKADAYGHGLLQIAQHAENYDLAVAIPEELSVLRQGGIENRVWVLEGFFSLQCLALSESVVWVVHSIWQFELLKRYVEVSKENINICIKFDTGMHRLGFMSSEIDLIESFLDELTSVNVYCVMTHFSMSDEPKHPLVLSQISNFDATVRKYSRFDVKQSLANSGAISFYPESHRDFVRPGIMLYGAKPTLNSTLPIELETVMSFQSEIIAIRTIQKDEYVGYGGSWQAKKVSVIATVAGGYADGYPRHAPNGTPVAILDSNNSFKIVELVGRVSMDMITIDVTDVSWARVGTKVELWGEFVSVDAVAEKSGTISYELLTAVSKRVPRIYQHS